MTDARMLVLIRHAKAEPHGTVADHERALTERGVRDAREIGRWMKDESIKPDFVWCSTAARTRQTWASIVDASGAGPLVDHEQRIYDASARTLVEVLRETPENASTVVLVGHAPGVPAVAAVLTENNSAVDFADHFVTSGVAVLRISGEWAELTGGVADLKGVFVGRG